MHTEDIHLAFASDAEGVEGLDVALFSALEQSSRPVRAWVIEDGIPRDLQRALDAHWRRHPNYRGTTFLPMRSLPIPMPSSWTRSAWPLTSAARFQLAEVIPGDIGRCIYLDIDILVGTDLAALFDLDLGAAPIGMVLNTRAEERVRHYLRTIDLDPDRYCNAGVLLIDLHAWRREKAAAGLIQVGRALPPNIWFFDQDMLNVYFKGRCRLLDERWNFRDAGVLPEGKVLHFAGRQKPWNIPPDQAMLPGHAAWHAARRRSGFAAPAVPARVKWKKRLAALVAKVQRRIGAR